MKNHENAESPWLDLTNGSNIQKGNLHIQPKSE